MLSVVWRGFVARKVRVTLTAVAIALGVTLMAGTYVLTDTINASFSAIFTTANAGSSVVVTPHEALGDNNQAQISPIDGAMLARVRQAPDVAEASGDIFSVATLLDSQGNRLDTAAPSFVSGVVPAPFEAFSTVSGRFPASSGEVALDQFTADRYHLRVGNRLAVAGVAPARRYAIVGIVHFAGSQSLGGAGVAVLTLGQAQQVAGEAGRFDRIDVAASAGTSASRLQHELRGILPASVDVRTGVEEAAQQSSDIASNLGFLRTFLLVFAYVALFVGAFIIFNTFSITVAQRTREFGMLRALGASRRQVLTSVLGESFLLGLIGSGVGLLLGVLVAPGLDQLFKSFGADLPDSGTVLEARTVVVSLVVGVVVSLLAGLPPALRATRVPPVAAMREGTPLEPSRLARHALPLTTGVVGVGVLAIVGGLTGHGGAALLGIGALLMFVGVVLLSPRAIPGLAKAIGLLVTWRGITGVLARENARRQPGRTAATAGALMIGLALVTFVSIVAAGTKASIDRAVDASFGGNLIVQSSSTASPVGIPASVASALRTVPGVGVVTPVSFSEARIRGIGGTQSVTGVDPATFGVLYRIDWHQGSAQALSRLGSRGAILTTSFADAHHLQVGSSLSLVTPAGKRVDVVVQGIANDNARLLGAITLDRQVLQQSFAQSNDAVDFVGYAPGASGSDVHPRVAHLLRTQFPQAESQTAAEFEQSQAKQVDALLALIDVLLALAIVVSLFGIVNTLVLSIYERRRELGMLRAIGTTRRQVRQLVRYESIVTSLIGGVIGLVVGTLFALAITRPLSGAGFVLSVPVGTLVMLLVLAAMAGVLASVPPARRAARLDVLATITTE